jgi:hypothetical protein
MKVVHGRAVSKLSRRRFLRGTAGAAIALPLLQSAGGSLRAQAAEVPERFIGLFVAQGLPEELSEPFFDFAGPGGVQPLASLKPFQDRITMVRGIDVRTQGPASTEHSKGCASFLCGYDYDNVESKGGLTLDWLIREEKQLMTPLPTVNTGIWGADDASERGRIVHSWRGKNQPNEPIADPAKVFEYLFGSVPDPVDPTAQKNVLYRKSVLDAVIEEYRFAMSEASGYGPAVRQLISNHLDTVRELELRVAGLADAGQMPSCMFPSAPPSIDGSGQFPPKTENWEKIWDVVADLFVLAYRCDLVRTGTFMVDSGGDKWAFTGKAGSTGNIHGDTLHNWHDPAHYPLCLEIWKWFYDKASDFLTRLDDPAFVDADGATLLSNTTVLIGTELGDPVHDLNRLTYMIAGARGRFQRGQFNYTGRTDVDFYNTVLTGLGIQRRIGTQANYSGDLSFIA